MEQAPLQTYGSALVFSPMKSEVRMQHWKERLSFIKNVKGIREGWDPCLQTLENRDSDYLVQALTFSSDGKVLASAAANQVRLWDATTGTFKQTLKVGGYTFGIFNILGIAFLPQLMLLVVSVHTVQLWDTTTGTWKQKFEGHSGRVYAAAFSSDGKVLASASEDRTVRLWDAITGACKRTLEGHNGSVYAVAFSPDGKFLASASSDETLRLWDATTGTWTLILEGHSYELDAVVAFSPDGRALASASIDETVRLCQACLLKPTEGRCKLD